MTPKEQASEGAGGLSQFWRWALGVLTAALICGFGAIVSLVVASVAADQQELDQYREEEAKYTVRLEMEQVAATEMSGLREEMRESTETIRDEIREMREKLAPVTAWLDDRKQGYGDTWTDEHQQVFIEELRRRLEEGSSYPIPNAMEIKDRVRLRKFQQERSRGAGDD